VGKLPPRHDWAQIWGFTLVFSARYGPCYWLTGLSACPHTFAVYSLFVVTVSLPLGT